MSQEKNFVHLHLHTCYSLLDGATRVEQLMETASGYGMPAVALTDHGVMYGAIDFYKSAMHRGIKPILGVEAYVAQGSRLEKRSGGPRSAFNHLVLLAQSTTGYHNLMKLSTSAQLEGFYYKPRIDKELLSEHSHGIIGLSACLKGEVASHLVADDIDAAKQTAADYADIFGKDNFFLELQDHGIPEQRKANKLIRELAANTGLPVVATNDVHYLEKDHAAAHEVLLCLQTQTVLTDPKRMRYGSKEFYLKTRAEMERLFPDVPEALDVTLDIADRCNVELEFGKLHFPKFQVPKGTNQKQYLHELCIEGIRQCYEVADPEHPTSDRERTILERYRTEIDIIERAGYINYFLVVWDFVDYARRQRIPVGPGRGSGGGSLVAYILGITAIDPLEYDLIFERFLNLERVSPPDFDIDFCKARRTEVIAYVREKYGRENVAQIITFGTLGAKNVIRDVGRVLEIPYGKCDQLSKMIPEDPKMKLKLALEMSPEFKKAYESDADCRRILDYGFVLEGLHRNPSTHAAGVVIGEKPLVEIVPLARDKDGEPVTQYTMEPLSEIGLLKMDFLGLRTLTVMEESVSLIKRTTGKDVDLATLPMDDGPSNELLNRGDTIGVFQLESPGMRDLIRRVGINSIKDLIAMIALYRPGPMNMLDDYVNRKAGKAKISYSHPDLEPILKETYGVMLYQEQVMKAANILAGYSLGDADILRRAMGKKKQSEMDKQRTRFVSGCKATKGISASLAERIFDTIAKFAGYGFNKAHSAGYGIIAYQTAFLKANYPPEFMAALLSSEIGNSDKLPFFINEVREMDLEILPPDVNSSGVRFTPGPTSIRFGLAGIKNVGEGAAEAIVAEREANGPYESLTDFTSRIDAQHVNKKVIESLIRCGAMDSLQMHRARLFNGIDFAMARAARELQDKQSGQGSLFDLIDDESAAGVTDELPDADLWPESDLLSAERELLGVYMSGHPLTRYAGLLGLYQQTNVSGLGTLEDRTATRIGGIIASITKRITKTTKQPMAVVSLEDLDGTLEVVVFPDAYQEYGHCLEPDKAVLICGEVSRREDPPKLNAQEIYALDDAPRHFARRLSIHIPSANLDDERLARIRDMLRMHPGHTPVVICLQFPSKEKVFLEADRTLHVQADEDLVHDLKQELGETSVYVAVHSKPCLKSHDRHQNRRRGNPHNN